MAKLWDGEPLECECSTPCIEYPDCRGYYGDGDEELPDDDPIYDMPEGAHERIRARFLELLAADEPDHPWVKRASGATDRQGSRQEEMMP